MTARVQIRASDDALSRQVAGDILAHRDDFAKGGVSLELEESYGFLGGGVGEGIFVGIITKIGADYAKKLLDLLVEAIRRRRHFGASVVVQRESHQFVLPKDYDKAVDYFTKEDESR